MSIIYPSSKNCVQKTLDAQLLSGATASVTLNNVVGIQNKAGVFVVDRVDANNTVTPTKREYISFTGVSGSTLTGLTRNADGGGSDQDHAVGAIVEFVSDVLQQQALIDTLGVQHGLTDGVHTNALVTSLKATGAVVNTGTSDVTIVTPKAIADSKVSITDKAETLTNKTLTSPKINEDVALTATATQLNAQVLASNDGWISANETWTYASATTITVPSGATAKYSKGDKIKLTQTTVKYFYIIGVADTVLTITGGASYTLANDDITLNYYSHQVSPVGFPKLMSLGNPTWTTSGTAFTNAPSSGTWYFWIIDGVCYYSGISLSNATSGGTGIFIATFTSGYLPPCQDSFGISGNIGSFVMGMSYTQGSVNNVIKMCKYDGSAIAANNQYFGCSGFYRF